MSLQVIARLSIHDGKLDDFKQVAEKCMQSVREKDPGTSQYDWYFNDDQTECVVIETYDDSAAVFAHVTNLGDTLGELVALCDLDLGLHGTPTDELAEAMTAMGAKIYAPFQSI